MTRYSTDINEILNDFGRWPEDKIMFNDFGHFRIPWNNGYSQASIGLGTNCGLYYMIGCNKEIHEKFGIPREIVKYGDADDYFNENALEEAITYILKVGGEYLMNIDENGEYEYFARCKGIKHKCTPREKICNKWYDKIRFKREYCWSCELGDSMLHG